MDGLVYIPFEERGTLGPFGRFLPLEGRGIAEKFIRKHLDPGSWVLDPFGASPHTALEMASSGCRLLVAVNNPVTQFILEILANPPGKADFTSGLAELAASRKGDERLENHIQALYMTSCSKCQRDVSAEAFIWDRATGKIIGKIYQCPCGESGEYPASEADQVRAARFAATDGLHRARALERVAGLDDPDRELVEAALECYLPRAIYALVTIINKLDNIPLDGQQRQALLALLLTACDESSSLWPHEGERMRPRQLVIPQQFLEKNLWMALEKGIEAWESIREPIPVFHWPSQPDEKGGLCIFPGPLRELTPQIQHLPIQAVVSVLPRPNQAFWTLSAIWSGWLWGRQSAASFKPVLHRRRYDWPWHAEALSATFDHLPDHLPMNTPVFGILTEPEPGFLSAAIMAAAASGYNLSGISMRTRHDPVQIIWNKRAFSVAGKEPLEPDIEMIIQSFVSFLDERSEPAPYLHLHAAGLAAMARSNNLPSAKEAGKSQFFEAMGSLNAILETTITSPLLRHHSEFSSPESGTWGLSEWNPKVESLPDRVEMAVVRFLISHSNALYRDVEEMLNNEMSGLNTPSRGLTQAVLNSYASGVNGTLNLRQEDDPSARRKDLEMVFDALSQLAKLWDLAVVRQQSPIRQVRWEDPDGLKYSFYLLVSARIREILMLHEYPAEKCVLLVPGGRVDLVTYKISRDPILKALSERWRMVPFRSLLKLAEMNDLTLDGFEAELGKGIMEPLKQLKLL